MLYCCLKEFLGLIFIWCSTHSYHVQRLPDGLAPVGAWDNLVGFTWKTVFTI